MKGYPSRLILNRELSWLHFNDRVVREGARKDVPLFERAKFIAIFSSNLDEFFQVRVGSLRDQRQAKYKKVDAAGLTPKEQLKAIYAHARKSVAEQASIYRDWLRELEAEEIFFPKTDSLSKTERKAMESVFRSSIYPSLTPLVLEEGKVRFANGRLYLLVDLAGKKGIVQVPPLLDRVIDGQAILGRNTAFLIDDVMAEYASLMFPDHKVKRTAVFRVTRSADIEVAVEDAGDLLEVIEQALPKRKNGRIVRVEMEREQPWAQSFLIEDLGVKKRDFIIADAPLDLTFLMKWKPMKRVKKAWFPEFEAADRQWWQKDIFRAIQKQEHVHMVPYEKFDPVLKLLDQAVHDPQVIAIQQTLYRVSENSPVIELLKEAALQGKQVTVAIELRARFDEENNIRWARELAEAGCQVVYGHPIQKVHAKSLLVIRKEERGLRTYLHMGTGNYNERTAKLYTDFGYFTANQQMGQDVMQMFRYITGAVKQPEFQILAVAPFTLREVLMKRIGEMEKVAKRGRGAWIFLKMNSLVDPQMIHALYKASQAGVKIDCLVRGICCLRPGLVGISENIRVKSIVGRFLEHQRVFYFSAGEQETLYMSSADWMPRNLNRRVELMFPVEDRIARENIKGWMQLQWQDENRAHMLKCDGTYQPLSRRKTAFDSQACFIGELMGRSRE